MALVIDDDVAAAVVDDVSWLLQVVTAMFVLPVLFLYCCKLLTFSLFFLFSFLLLLLLFLLFVLL